MTTLPTIHLNGTSPRSSVSEYRALCDALEAASAALEAASCNTRDFYPQGGDAWQRARKEREEAFAKLAEVQTYAEAWLYHASQA